MIEAKDTVMKKRWMNKKVQEDQDRLLLEQAEISLKAGMGRVVKWIEARSSLHQIIEGGVVIMKAQMLHEDWQAFKKKGGL